MYKVISVYQKAFTNCLKVENRNFFKYKWSYLLVIPQNIVFLIVGAEEPSAEANLPNINCEWTTEKKGSDVVLKTRENISVIFRKADITDENVIINYLDFKNININSSLIFTSFFSHQVQPNSIDSSHRQIPIAIRFKSRF